MIFFYFSPCRTLAVLTVFELFIVLRACGRGLKLMRVGRDSDVAKLDFRQRCCTFHNFSNVKDFLGFITLTDERNDLKFFSNF